MSSARGHGPLRLLTVLPSEAYGGAERYGIKIAGAAVARGWDVSTALRELEDSPEIRAELRSRGVRTLRLADGRRLRGGLGFGALLALHRPDVVHITAPWPLAFLEVRLACAVLGVPAVVVNALVPDLEELHVTHPRAFRWTRRRRQRWVAFSHYGVSVLAEAFALEREEVQVIYNGVRPTLDDGVPEARSVARAKFGIDDGDFAVVDVARLSPEKGIDLLIEASARLVTRFPRLRVLIAGEGPERPALEAQIVRHGLADHLRLLGSSEMVGTLLCGADLFAFPSRHEGNPGALLEAMSSGVPVVCASFGGADEVITRPEMGVLIPKDDVDALARAIAASIEDPAAAARRAALGRSVRERFDERRMLDDTLTLLERTAGGPDQEAPTRTSAA